MEFRRESFDLFEKLLGKIRHEGIRFLSRVEIETDKKDNLNKPKQKKETFQHQESSSAFDAPNQNTPKEQQESNQGSGNRTLRRAEAKIARKKGKKN